MRDVIQQYINDVEYQETEILKGEQKRFLGLQKQWKNNGRDDLAVRCDCYEPIPKEGDQP